MRVLIRDSGSGFWALALKCIFLVAIVLTRRLYDHSFTWFTTTRTPRPTYVKSKVGCWLVPCHVFGDWSGPFLVAEDGEEGLGVEGCGGGGLSLRV